VFCDIAKSHSAAFGWRILLVASASTSISDTLSVLSFKGGSVGTLFAADVDTHFGVDVDTHFSADAGFLGYFCFRSSLISALSHLPYV